MSDIDRKSYFYSYKTIHKAMSSRKGNPAVLIHSLRKVEMQKANAGSLIGRLGISLTKDFNTRHSGLMSLELKGLSTRTILDEAFLSRVI